MLRAVKYIIQRSSLCAGCLWGSQDPVKVLTGAAHFGSGQKAMCEHGVGLQGSGNRGTIGAMKIWPRGGTEGSLVNAPLEP